MPILKGKIKEREATKMEVSYLKGNKKRSYTAVLCLREMAYPFSWNTCSFTHDILAAIDTHAYTCRKAKKKMWRGKV